MRNRLILSYFIVWLGSVLWITSGLFIDNELMPKWYAALFGANIFFCLYFILVFFCCKQPDLSIFKAFAVAFLLCATSQAVYGLLQWSGTCPAVNGFPLSGSFDNPAGIASALAFAVPFGLYLSESKSSTLRYLSYALTAILLLAVILSESRSGMLAIWAVLIIYCPAKWTKIRKPLAIGMLLATFMAAFILYHYKKDSADGRRLIWQCTWELVKERPLTGHGIGGFESGYMHRQAGYFLAHPDSPYARLADNVNAPFNEYLHLLVSFGAIGGITLLLLIFLLWRAWRKQPDSSSLAALLCLVSIAVFSMFSYPFRYAHTWIACGFSVAFLLFRNQAFSRKMQGCITLSCTLFFSIVSAFAFRHMQAEMLWCKTADRALCGTTERIFPVYRQLYKQLKHEPLFLYNYAAELNIAGKYRESLAIGKTCEKQLADYDLQLLQADNCKQLGRYEQAVQYLHHAANMCPNRFTPLYELYKIHETRNDSTAMKQTAHTILGKPVKIDSPEVRRIIREISSKHEP